MPRYPTPTILPIAIDNGALYLQSIIQDSSSSSNTACRGLAIIAHPLGRLGGSFDDAIVTHLASLFLTHFQLRVVRFNSRGVGKSGGSPSWTGRSECSDFQELLLKCVDNFCLDFPDSIAAQLVVAGYSAGSLYATTVRVPKGVYETRQFRGGKKPRYVLVSFPAGVTWALSFFTTKTYNDALKELLGSQTLPGGNATEVEVEGQARAVAAAAAKAVESTSANDADAQPVAGHVLAVYGDADQFTGIKTYHTWTKECSSLAPSPNEVAERENGSTFHHVLIEGADHFYRSNEAVDGLDKAVVEWYEALAD